MNVSLKQKTLPKPFSGSTLKLFAMFSMLIDHIGAAFLIFYLQNLPANSPQTTMLTSVYQCMRGFGRLAFPIFCFLLVEGFLHTSNVKKYATRLALFCIVSEIPFNLAFYHRISFRGHQNVFFTLLIGLLVLIAMQSAVRLPYGIPQILAYFAAIFIGCYAADFLHTDYGSTGVLVIVIFYVLRKTPVFATLAACIVLTLHYPTECYTFFIVLLLPFYNGKRGLKLKYAFYLFYPLHLLALYLLSQILPGSIA